MTNLQILDTFYNQIVPEAQKGRINCYFTANIAFNLVIDNQKISKCPDLPYVGILIATLKITNKHLFDDLLVEYVKKALDFYNPLNFAFLNDIKEDDDIDLRKSKEVYLIKYIISSAFANASFIDFEYPIVFLQSRIAMFDHRILNHEGILDFGYISSIGARMYVEEEKSSIKSETPYKIKSYLQFDDGYRLSLPEIYVGSNGEKYQLYAIQKSTSNDEIEIKPYLKQIRKGFIAKIKGAPEHYFLAVMLFLSLCSDKEIEIVPLLVERWNAKRIAMYIKSKKNFKSSLLDIEKEQDRIQNNITDIFIHYFTKLKEISTGINFRSIPYETDTSLHINIYQDFVSRSMAFNELFRLASEYKEQKNKLGR